MQKTDDRKEKQLIDLINFPLGIVQNTSQFVHKSLKKYWTFLNAKCGDVIPL